MKKGIIVATIMCGLSFAGQVQAGSNAASGLLLGAGGGALAGQAIGRDTRGTLVGAAVGTVLGYAIGNEMDKGGAGPRYYQPPVYMAPRVVAVRPESRETCREMELLATIDGRPEKVYGTVCRQDGEWVRLAEERPQVIYETVIIRDEYYRYGRPRGDYRRHDHDDHDDHHDRHGRGRRVRHRPGW